MENFVKSLSNSQESKKLAVMIYYSLMSKKVPNDHIYEFLKNLKYNPEFNQLPLHKNSFIYKGELKRLIKYQDLKYLEKKTKTGRRLMSVSDFKKKNSKELEYLMEELEYDYGCNLIPKYKQFIWLTNSTKSSLDLKFKLGLEMPETHLVLLSFNKQEHKLYTPTVAEGHGNKWFFSNPNNEEYWGKTVDIKNINSACANCFGESEALSKDLNFVNGTEVKYLGLIDKDMFYFDEQFDTLLNCLEDNIFNDSIIDDIIMFTRTMHAS